jgi:putative endonuclease
VTQNYHCRFGEIDLIMTEAKTLVFVEVKLRSNNQFGGAAASITPQKQKNIILTAQHYLQRHVKNQIQTACRFDAILMDKTNINGIEWIRNAFET